jgi:peptidoglycan hydrolase-like protein with peptidoglycan-binding domain
MKRCVLCLIIGLFFIWPLDISAGQAPTKDQIKRVQERLKDSGLDPGPFDGAIGRQTEAALRVYQQQQGLPLSGQLDDATLQALLPDAVLEAQTPRVVIRPTGGISARVPASYLSTEPAGARRRVAW